ncbi:MAG TPA: hypothetical protein DD671_10775, partial [Balneolaceae bacterium]|nr:hypothetical protein [Balneolaceae bacterium]
MRKHTQNVLLDVCLFVGFIGLIATGIILYFVLPPGSRQDTFAVLTRHQWGDIHFWIAAAFTAFIALHLTLHASWLKSSYFR